MLSAQAASLQITPISLEISAREQGQAIVLSNSGKTVLYAQVRVQQWVQADGQEQLLPTRDVVASPPAVEIAPGARQMVRIVRLQSAPLDVEKTYRLIVDELPAPEAASGTPAAPGAPAGGLQFLLRYSVPVFVLPASLPEPAAPTGPPAPTDISTLSASLKIDAPSAATLSIGNRGTRRVKLSQLSYTDPQGKRAMLVPGLLGYVLAGQRMQWPLVQTPALQAGGIFKAKFNDDQAEQIVPLALDRP